MFGIEAQFVFSYAILGCCIGFLAGLLGIGGGSVMVPIFAYLFLAQGVKTDVITHLALGTSMASIVVVSLISCLAHHRKRAVLWDVVYKVSPGVILGTIVAASIVSWLSSDYLTLIFVFLILLVALQMFFSVKTMPTKDLPGQLGLFNAGVIIGSVSPLVAIGGGALTVPFLVRCKVKIREAIGTSSALGVPLSLAGSLGYWFAGIEVLERPSMSLGYIYLPAVFFVTSLSFIFIPIGVWCAHRAPVDLLQRIFALFLMVLSLLMLYLIVID